MRYEDHKLLLEFARLNLEIAIAKCPVEAMNMSPENITRSIGYKKLRAFFVNLTPRPRDRFRRFMTEQIQGVRALLAQAKATGERIDMADITFETYEAPTEPVITSTSCKASGAGIPGVTRDAPGAQPYIQCPQCLARWFAHDIGFKIPTHEPLTA